MRVYIIYQIRGVSRRIIVSWLGFGLGRKFKRAEGARACRLKKEKRKKKNLFPQRDSRQPVTRESTRHEFVLFYDICRRLIFSANRLSASKWSSRRNEEGCRARGVARGGEAGGGEWRGMKRRKSTRIEGERERERWVVAAYLRIYASTREKKEEEEGREERKVKVDTLVRPAFAHLCSFFTMVERLR